MIFLDTLADPKTLLTLSGSASAVWLITSVICHLFNLPSNGKAVKWVGFALALGIALLGALQVVNKSALDWLAAIINGFIIYAAAVGVNTIVASSERAAKQNVTRPTGATDHRTLKDIFTKRWWN